mmetsp:Transcript_14392/g.35092  ORF Transcript_14392/g.35092 Transcript_14392/m.35092 type:complete len:98 (+) Transcript_14392:58-351(+)
MGANLPLFPSPPKSIPDPRFKEFEAAMDKFDVVLDRCDRQTAAYTECINHHQVGDIAGIYSGGMQPQNVSVDEHGTCGKSAVALLQCYERRELRHSK